MKRIREYNTWKEKGNITHEKGISEVVSIERETKMLAETHLLYENNGETTGKPRWRKFPCSIKTGRRRFRFRRCLWSTEQRTDREVSRRGENERRIWEKAFRTVEGRTWRWHSWSTTFRKRNNRETTGKQQGNLGDANSLDVL